MSIKTMSSKKMHNNGRDKVTDFMITMTDQFRRELESSRNIAET